MSFVFILTFGSLLSFGCDKNEALVNDNELINQIALHNSYDEYRKAQLENSMNIINVVYNVEPIHKIWVQKGPNQSFCTIQLSEKDLELKGIEAYQKSACKVDEKLSHLQEYFPNFEELEPSIKTQIIEVYNTKVRGSIDIPKPNFSN